jgi:hypothetical protein
MPSAIGRSNDAPSCQGVTPAMALPKHLEGQEKLDRREANLRKFTAWPQIEVRLKHRWSPDRVLEWHNRRFPGEAAPNRRTLFRFLEDKPESWFVSLLDPYDLVTGKVTEHVIVLEEQAAMIDVICRFPVAPAEYH